MLRRATLGILTLAARIALGQAAPASPAPALGLAEWLPGFVIPGSASMRLLGDAGKPELFAVRFRYPDGARLAPHWHTATVHITVLRGALAVGMGDRVDSTKVEMYGPGSFLVLEGGMHHYEWFQGETVVHVEGVGPFRTVFVNPADDPRDRPSR